MSAGGAWGRAGLTAGVLSEEGGWGEVVGGMRWSVAIFVTQFSAGGDAQRPSQLVVELWGVPPPLVVPLRARLGRGAGRIPRDFHLLRILS